MPKIIGKRDTGGLGGAWDVQADDGSIQPVADFALSPSLRREYESRQRAEEQAAVEASARAEADRLALEGPSPTDLARMSIEDGRAATEAARLRREQTGAVPELAMSVPPEQMQSVQPPATPESAPMPPPGPSGGPAGLVQQAVMGAQEPGTSLRASSTTTGRPGGGGSSLSGVSEIRAGAANAAKAQDAAVEASRAEGQQRAAAIEGTKAQLEAQDAAEMARQQRVQAARDEQMKTVSRLSDALSKEEGSISTSRWWSSRTSGQKVLAGLSAFLSGFAGDVSPVFKFIDDDIAAQRDALDRKAEGKKNALAGANNLLATMRANGMDDAQAAQAARASYLQRSALELDRIAASTNDAKVKAQADLAKAQIQQELGKSLSDIGDRAAQRQIQREGLDLQRAELMLEARTAGAGDPGKQVTAGEAAKVGEIDAGLALLEKLGGDWKKDVGFASALTQFLPGTDASKFNDKRAVATQIIGGILEGGKLTEDDFARYSKMMPEPSDSNDRAMGKLAAIANSLREKRKATIGGLTQAGFNTGGFRPTFTEQAPPAAKR